LKRKRGLPEFAPLSDAEISALEAVVQKGFEAANAAGKAE